MTLGVLATKLGMTQIFTEEGVRVPVTVLQVTPNHVVQKKTQESDGYTALQIGYGDKPEKRTSKAMLGHYQQAKVPCHATLREFRVGGEELEKFNVGDSIGLELLQDVKSVDVAGISKGKGFAGVMKRHNFKGFRATHGTHEYFRHGGSIGCRAVPGKVFKGKKMAGQMGNERVTVMNLNVIQVLPESGLVLLRGAVPGGKNAVVELRPSLHKVHAVPGLSGEVQVASKNPMKASKAKK